MSEVTAALAEIAGNQNPVSDFINSPPAAPSPDAAPSQSGAGAGGPVKRGRGRPPGSKKKTVSTVWDGIKAAPPPAEDAETSEEKPEDIEAVRRKVAAHGATAMIQNTGLLLAGDDGKMAKEEFLSVSDSFERYFAAKGIVDFPPGISLGLGLGAYYARVMLTQTAQPKVFGFIFWLKNKIGNFRKKTASEKAA